MKESGMAYSMVGDIVSVSYAPKTRGLKVMAQNKFHIYKYVWI